MSVVCKMHIQSETTWDPNPPTYQLGVVCRGELNKDWASATPSGSASLADPLLGEILAAKRRGERPSAEVYIYQTPDPDGEWQMSSCDFAYTGCQVRFNRLANGCPGAQKLELTINASAATAVLRKAYADGLLAGKAPRFRIEVEDAPEPV